MGFNSGFKGLMSGDWRGTLWILLVTFCIVIIRCTETFWSPCTCTKYIIYVRTSAESALVGPQNQHLYHITLSITPHKTSFTYIHTYISWKWVVSNPVCSTEATRGCGRVSHVYDRADQHVWLTFCEFLVGAPRFVLDALHQCIHLHPLATGLPTSTTLKEK